MGIFRKHHQNNYVSAKKGFRHVKNQQPLKQKQKVQFVPKTKEPQSGAKSAALAGSLPG